MQLDTTVDPDDLKIYEVAAFREDLLQHDIEDLEPVRWYENQSRVRALQFATEWSDEGLSVVICNQQTGGTVKTVNRKKSVCRHN